MLFQSIELIVSFLLAFRVNFDQSFFPFSREFVFSRFSFGTSRMIWETMHWIELCDSDFYRRDDELPRQKFAIYNKSIEKKLFSGCGSLIRLLRVFFFFSVSLM